MRILIRPLRLAAALLASAALALPAEAQGRQPASWFTPAHARRAEVQDALAWIETNFPRQVEEWIHITQIPAPSGQEGRRAAYLKGELEKMGMEVTIDSIGNLTATRRGMGGGPRVVIAAHLDTVHPIDTDVTVKRDGDVLRAPGVFDNSASLADLLAVFRAMDAAKVRTRGDLVLVGTAQEELGLKGMDWWLERNARPGDVLIAVDGGLGMINYGALGIYWSRYRFTGEGSHTNTSAGKPHPARALSEAIRSVYEIRIPEGRGGAVYNVGMLAGGKIFNAIPEEVSFTMDLRSVNPALLDSLDREIDARVARAAAAEGVRWTKEQVTRNRAGGTEEALRDRRAHPLVQTAVDVHRHLGIDAPAVASGSTDSNMAVVRGIPAVAVGRARGGNQHTLSEYADAPSALPATRMLLLLLTSAAGLR